MKRFGLILRILTLTSWFLPFAFFMSTCVGSEYKTAYNKKDAYENIRLANLELIKEFDRSAAALREQTNGDMQQKIDSFRIKMQERLYAPFNQEKGMEMQNETEKRWQWQAIAFNIMIPNYYSLSGWGTVMEFKNAAGRVFSAAALALSFLALILWKKLRRSLRLTLLVLIIIFALAMFLNGLLIKADFLYGFWIFVLLLLVQLYVGLREGRDTSTTAL